MLRKSFLASLLCGVTAVAFVSCDDDDKKVVDKPDTPDTETQFPVITKGHKEAYVLTQGAFYSKLEGSFNVIDLEDKEIMEDVFTTVNKRSLGATPQCGLAYGGKIYLGMYESNTIEVVDRYTFESVKQITLSGSTMGQQPRSMVANGGKVYISMYDGYVARLDTTSRTIDAAVKVGPNPEKICLHDGKIYVPNSDGMNWQNDYSDGTTVSVVGLSPFAVEKTLTVPLNPGNCVSAGGNVFVLCKGNYADIPSRVYCIENDGNTTDIAGGNMITSSGNKVYIIDAHYDKTGNNYSVYDAVSKQLTPFVIDGVDYPNGIAVDEEAGRMLISSNVWGATYPEYEQPGYVMEFKLGGRYESVKKYPSGVGEATIFFSEPLK